MFTAGRATKLANDGTDVLSRLPVLEDLTDLPEGVLREIVDSILDEKNTDEPQAVFQSSLSP